MFGFRNHKADLTVQLSHAISEAHASRVIQNIAHNSRHSTLPIPIPSFLYLNSISPKRTIQNFAMVFKQEKRNQDDFSIFYAQ